MAEPDGGKGLALHRLRLRALFFEKGEPGEYIYRIQLLDYPAAHAESAAYLAFLEETGVEVIATWFRWVFLRKGCRRTV